MKSGTSGKPFTTDGKFDRDKFITYKKHNDVLTALCRDGYGVEIDGDVFIVRSVVRCPETLKCRTVVGRLRMSDGFLKMSTDRKKERILKTLKK